MSQIQTGNISSLSSDRQADDVATGFSFKRLFDLKSALYNLTQVPSERQKILGLVKGKLPPDSTPMWVAPSWPRASSPTRTAMDDSSDIHIVSGKKFILIGTPEGDEIKDPSR